MSLHELTKRRENFEWTADRNYTFELKDKLVTAPILAMSQDEGNYTLDVDASNWAVGTVFQQEQEGLLRVFGYASKSFTAAEQRYCITCKELAGMIFRLKHYRQYLLGRQFTIRTDHAALSYLLTAKDQIGQQARWVDLMSEYTFTIKHRAGTSHSNADNLSRILPCEEDGDESTQCHKHICGSFAAEDDGREEKVICVRVRVLRLTQEEQMDTESKPNLTPTKIEAPPGTSDTPTNTEAPATTLVDLQDILSPQTSRKYRRKSGRIYCLGRLRGYVLDTMLAGLNEETIPPPATESADTLS